MSSATNVDATAVNTIDWLSASDTTIVVPVYQRQYRWDIGGCEQLLGDIRAAAAGEDGHTHFIGSILSTASTSAAITWSTCPNTSARRRRTTPTSSSSTGSSVSRR